MTGLRPATYACDKGNAPARGTAVAETVQQDQTIPPEINAWFFRETSLDEPLRGVAPLESMDDLAIEDLTPEEAVAFLKAIEE